MSRLVRVVSLVLIAAFACVPRTATVEGDVYLVMQSGDTKRGAGRHVYLVQTPDSVIKEVQAICATWGAEVGNRRRLSMDLGFLAKAITDEVEERLRVGIHVGNVSRLDSAEKLLSQAKSLLDQASALQDSALFAIGVAVSRAALDSSDTGIDAHYKFSRVRAGHYALYAQWRLGENDYRWWAPVDVSAGDSLRKDLDNKVELGGTFTCSQQE